MIDLTRVTSAVRYAVKTRLVSIDGVRILQAPEADEITWWLQVDDDDTFHRFVLDPRDHAMEYEYDKREWIDHVFSAIDNFVERIRADRRAEKERHLKNPEWSPYPHGGGPLTMAEVKDALDAGARERTLAERTMKRSPRR